MKKYITSLFLITVFFDLISQDLKTKELTLENAVMGFYNGLYPNNMYGLKWADSNMLYLAKGDDIRILSPFSKNKEKTLSLKKDLIEEKNSKNFKILNYQNNKSFSYVVDNNYCFYNLSEKKCIKVPSMANNITVSPKNNSIAYTIKNNLFYANSEDSIIKITDNINKNITSGQSIHRNEFGITNGIFWSNKGEKLAFYEKDESDVHDYPLLDISATPGKLNTIKYPMAGQKSEYARVGIYSLKNDKIIYLKTQHPMDDYITNLTWGPNDKFVYLGELNRDQNHLKWAQYDVNSGNRIKTIYEETNQKWVEPEYPIYFIPGSKNEFITLSERDGFMNIYHYNTDGKLISQITKNKWVTTKIKHVSKELIYYEGTGEDPRSLHTFSIQINGKNQKQLTIESGVHKTKLSTDNKYLLDQFSDINVPGITQLINTKNNEKRILNIAKNPLEGYVIGTTELVNLKSNNNLDLHARIIKPSYFNEKEKYPVLVYVYGGPHAQLVTNSWLGGSSLWMYWMAEQGYIIFTLDGRGSANRGFEFESAIFRNLGEIEMEDQISGIEYLKNLNFVDSNKLAVHGWSYGGFMTTSLMTRHPDIFKVGVAGGPVIDWKWYEVMYGERYMDTPKSNKEGYEKSSLLNYVKYLKGNLLLIHGTVDDVVVMQHNLAYIKKSIEEGIHVDFFPYPMHKHNVRGKDRIHLMEKVLNYIIRKN